MPFFDGGCVMKKESEKGAIVYLHSSEDMQEVKTNSVSLLLGASVFLGKGVEWGDYAKLYDYVYNREGQRILRKDGLFVVIQTNAYMRGAFVCRYKLLLDLLLPAGWKLIDERVWSRVKANNFQCPFSHVFVFVPPGGTRKRMELNRTKGWFQGVWSFPQDRGGELNSWPSSLCQLLIEACSSPGDLIVDPFAGTGKLLGLASRLGRLAVGYEIDRSLVGVLEKNGCRVLQN